MEGLNEKLACLMRAGFKRILLLNAYAANEGPGILVFHQLHLKHSGDKPDLWLEFSRW